MATKKRTRKQAENIILNWIVSRPLHEWFVLKEACASCAIEGNRTARLALGAMRAIPFAPEAPDECVIALSQFAEHELEREKNGRTDANTLTEAEDSPSPDEG